MDTMSSNHEEEHKTEILRPLCPTPSTPEHSNAKHGSILTVKPSTNYSNQTECSKKQ